MIVCKICESEYENSATFCNICDVDLVEENTVNKTVPLTENARVVLGRAKKTIMNIHNILGILQLLLILLIGMNAVLYNQKYHMIVPMLFLALIPCIHFVTAWGVKNDKQWSHLVSTIIGFVLLIGIPIGTILGYVLLKNLFKKEWDLVGK